jgi:hypothetical protein
MFLSVFIPILFIALFVFRYSFGLGFGGDDYFGLLDYLRHLENNQLVNWHFFFWQYGPQDTLFGFLYRIFGLNPTPFFIFSFVLRMLAAASFYPIIQLFTKRNSAIFLSILFFAVTFSGIETTGWGFNMMAYLAIAFLNTFLYTYIQSIKTRKKVLYILSAILFFITIVLSPTRMTGLIFLVLGIETYLFMFQERTSKTIRNALMRIALCTFAFFFILFLGNSLSDGNTFSERFHNLITLKTADTSTAVSTHLARGDYAILLHPIEQVGSLVFPSADITKYEGIFTNPVRYILFFTIFFLLLSTLLFKFSIPAKNSYRIHCICIVLSSILTYIFLLNKQAIFPVGIGALWFLIGNFVISSAICLYLANKKQRFFIALSLLWMSSSIFVFWDRFPELVHPIDHRYLISPVVGITFLLASFLASIKRKSGLIVFLCIIFIFSHAKGTYNYLHELARYRNKQINTNVRNSLPNITELSQHTKPDNPLVFYFVSDNPKALYHNVLFGFPTMVAIHEGIMSYPNLVYTDNWAEIVSAYKTGESLKRFSFPEKPTPIENIFSYKLETDHLVDTTHETRDILTCLDTCK